MTQYDGPVPCDTSKNQAGVTPSGVASFQNCCVVDSNSSTAVPLTRWTSCTTSTRFLLVVDASWSSRRHALTTSGLPATAPRCMSCNSGKRPANVVSEASRSRRGRKRLVGQQREGIVETVLVIFAGAHDLALLHQHAQRIEGHRREVAAHDHQASARAELGQALRGGGRRTRALDHDVVGLRHEVEVASHPLEVLRRGGRRPQALDGGMATRGGLAHGASRRPFACRAARVNRPIGPPPVMRTRSAAVAPGRVTP